MGQHWTDERTETHDHEFRCENCGTTCFLTFAGGNLKPCCDTPKHLGFLPSGTPLVLQ